MSIKLQIRPIKSIDVSEALAVYQPFVLESMVTFESEVPSLEEFTNRVEQISSSYPWLVFICDGVIKGYVYAFCNSYIKSADKPIETAIYLSPDFHRKGIGALLYQTLLKLLAIQGYKQVHAAVGINNEGSLKFHETLGFVKVGIKHDIGFKQGIWHDIFWLQYALSDSHENLEGQTILYENLDKDTVKWVLDEANQKLSNC